VTTTDARGVVRAPTSQIMLRLIPLWFLWGATYLGIALLLESMPVLMGNGSRFLVAGVILSLGLVLLRGPRVLAITRTQLRSVITMGVMILSVGIGLLSLAERYVPSGIAALLVSITPLLIVIFRLRAGDRPTRLTLIGVAVGLAGLALMLLPGGTVPVSGTDTDVVLWSAVIVVGSLSWAYFSWRSTSYDLPADPLATTVYELLTAGVVLTVVGFLLGERWDFASITTGSWIGWGYLVLASLIAYAAYVWLLDNAPISLTSTYAYVNPVVAVILGSLIIAEPLSRDVVIGLTIVVGGVVLVVTGERRRTPAIPTDQPAGSSG
jgi:drug/metabolite transporter (DMT)-like permease